MTDHVNHVRDEVRVMVDVSVGKFSLLAGMVQGSFHDEALVKLEIAIAVQVNTACPVHLFVVGLDMVNET